MIPRLLVVTPPAGPVTTACVEAADALGIAVAILLREPGTDPGALLEPGARVAALREAALRRGMPVLLSCSVADAEALAPAAAGAGLSGLQLRGDPSDAALLCARAAWPGAMLGASVHGEARPTEADYVVFAPVFTPRTAAPFPKRPAGLPALTAWTRRHPTVFALGGVTTHNAPACAQAGVHGIAGISTFLGTPDAVAETLRALVSALTLRPDVPPRTRG